MSFWSRITYAFRGDRLNHEIDEEFAAHIAEAIAAGNDPTEVGRTFGSQLRLREQSRDARVARWLDNLRADFIFGCRQLLKRKITTTAAILSPPSPLAPAPRPSASSTRSFSAPSPWHMPIVSTLSSARGPTTLVMRTFDDFAYPNFTRMRAAAKGQAELIATSLTYRTDLTYATDNEMERGYVQYVSGTMFPIFSLEPTLGRLFTTDDDTTPGAHPYAVISYNYWSRRFGSDPQVLGRTIPAEIPKTRPDVLCCARRSRVKGHGWNAHVEGRSPLRPGILTASTTSLVYADRRPRELKKWL